MDIQSVAVFCGSQTGKNPLFFEHTTQLGKALGALEIKLVYGGGKKGLMGAIADAFMTTGGTVMGVIPEVLLEWEQQHTGITELIVTPDMHSRKKLMYEMCDAVIILPGGFGTLDELFEMLTWNQLRIHNKPIYLLNSGGFYNALFLHLKLMETEGFLYEKLSERIFFCEHPDNLVNLLITHQS